jgi:FMN phosphatase YigB (HAD superfamily)
MSIKHVWFDFSDTIAFINREAHDKLRYESYAAATGKPVTPELIKEYEELYRKNQKSNAAVFRSLGLPSGYWSDRVNSADPGAFYKLAESTIPAVLQEIRTIVPISIFSNINLEKVLPSLGIQLEWFSHILASSTLKNPKPALDGFYKMIELSVLPPEQILYIGDDVGKDILPAKTVGIQAGIMWHEAPEADYSFKNFEDILPTIGLKQ